MIYLDIQLNNKSSHNPSMIWFINKYESQMNLQKLLNQPQKNKDLIENLAKRIEIFANRGHTVVWQAETCSYESQDYTLKPCNSLISVQK